MIDTHTHLYLEEFASDDFGADAVERAIAAGVERMVLPNVDLQTIAPMRALAARYPERLSMAIGLHPTEASPHWQEDMAAIVDSYLRHQDYVAFGEIGIDLYWDKTYEDEQMQLLEQQACIAASNDLPIIIHCREGLAQTLEVLNGVPDIKGVFHSFGGSIEDVKAIREVGDFYFGINGVVTFKNAHVKDALAEITLDRIVLETDAPYLAPVPRRGKRNESAYLPYTAQFIADYMGIPLPQLDKATTANAKRLFNLP